MSILFAGSSIADFVTGNTPTVNTTAGQIGPYVKEGMNMGGTTAKNGVSDIDIHGRLGASSLFGYSNH